MADTLSNTPPVLQFGWIGLGSMGHAMAKNVHAYLQSQSGTSLSFYNRTASRGDDLEQLGGKRCASVAELAACSNAIFISASDDTAVQSIIEQIISSGSVLAGKIIVDTTTIHPNTTKEISQKLQARGAHFAAMPVFGATPVAEQGKLLAVFAGPEDVYEMIAPVLKGVLAREVLLVGKEPEKATLLKTTGNFVTAGLMEIIAEAHVFAEKTGLSSAHLEKLLALNFGTVAHSISTRMTTGVYIPGNGETPWSDLNLALKDVGHGVDSAKQAGVSLKVGNTALEHLERAKMYSEKNGKRPLDSSSLYGIVRQDSGLDFRTDYVQKRDQ
ncbi:NAD binding domain of 6-phosphogluconate dehydrogenase-domain-containing protein [Xylaria castorea]|nr:NAD binding domain of 6-phosphogluconate dehydrogenase-domain-containing protein [Xylaria castorea]